MTGELFLSRFTPSMMSPDVLEKVFVQRGDLAARVVELVEESIRTPSKHHTLIVGPRGSGKTHLLALVHNRVDAKADLAEKVRVAWLREEEWGVASFLDFLYRILRALAARYQDRSLQNDTERLFEMPLKSAERRAGELLREFIDGRVLLVITENVDALFQGLGKRGQQRLRAYLQEEQSWTILGSAQALFAGVTLHASPFYGFFDIHHLQELTVDDAARLVRNIAELSGNPELASFVLTEQGRARIRAVHHLAGGNHRVYMILSEFLTRESLDQLVGPFLRMMDDLTPYYQAKMEQLSPQQRKIIDLLCSVRGAVPVKEIAKRCFITPQTASSQLKDLRERGFVDSTPVGRDAYYEIAEPLMRLALEVKHQRNETIGLFLEFLRHWYAPTELAHLLETTPMESILERKYIQSALWSAAPSDRNPRLNESLLTFENRARSGDWAGAFAAAQQLVEERADVEDWTYLAQCLVSLSRIDDAIAVLQRAVAGDPEYGFAWICMAIAEMHRKNYDSAVRAAERGVNLASDVAYAHAVYALALHLSSRYADALHSWERAIVKDPEFGEAWRGKGDSLFALGKYPQALQAVEVAIGWLNDVPDLQVRRGEILNRLRCFSQAIDQLTDVLDEYPNDVTALRERALALYCMREVERAHRDLKRASSISRREAVDLVPLVTLLMGTDLASEVLPLVDGALAEGGPPAMLLGFKIWALFSLGRYDDDAVAVLEQWLESPGIMDWRAYITELIVQDLHEGAHYERVVELTAAYDQYGLGPVLAAAIVKSARKAIVSDSRPGTSRAWVEVWTAAAEGHADLGIAVKLLSAVVEFRESGDRRALLRLPLEVRQLAEELFDENSPLGEAAQD